MVRKIIRYALYLVALAAAWVGFWLAFGTINDWRPKGGEKTPLSVVGNPNTKKIASDTFNIFSWNIGYCGMGAETDFFFDRGATFTSGGGMVYPPKDLVEKYLNGFEATLKNNPADFYFIQEVDTLAKRSYHINEFKETLKNLPDYNGALGINYDCKYVPLPTFEPWHFYGDVKAGVATFASVQPIESTRHQLPSEYSWPTRIFQLDRCLLVERFKTKKGKDLVLINMHNSAHDHDGSLKKKEMIYLSNFCTSEFEKGNYVIAGGDWNECPPYFKFDALMPGKGEGYEQINVDGSIFNDFQFIYDPVHTTNRKADLPYEHGKTFSTIIDFFLVSPNVKSDSIQVLSDSDFKYSDHQPIIGKFHLL